ncbi:MAG: hypothetical protein ABI822_22150 [Bryobacteraceae bacterium]
MPLQTSPATSVFRSRFLASTIFDTLARISSSEARDQRNLARAEAAAFFLRRLLGPQRARAAFRARAERRAASNAFVGFLSLDGK